MGENVKLIEERILNDFPGLANDTSFRLNSKPDRQYNCLAWAYQFFKDRWMEHNTNQRLDGKRYWWPEGATVSPLISAYIEAFEIGGFQECQTGDYEKGFIKVALYIDPISGFCKHGARQRTDGMWWSKLGEEEDIIHGSPFSLEGSYYGKVHCFLKMKF